MVSSCVKFENKQRQSDIPSTLRAVLAADGSDQTRAALNFVERLFPSNARITVLSVADVSEPHSRNTHDGQDDEIRQVQEETGRAEIHATVELVRSITEELEHKGWRAYRMLRIGHPAEEILRACEETDTDLLTVGSRGLGKFRGWLLGSVSQAVVNNARCSVLVVRDRSGHANGSPKSPPRILFATDGSDDAASAGNALLKYSLCSGANLRVLTVVHSPASSSLGIAVTQLSGSINGDELKAAEEFVSGIGETFRRQCQEVTTEVREGSPADQIIECANVWDADLIVLGSKGLSSVKALLMGSVSQKVAMYAACSVLVVK